MWKKILTSFLICIALLTIGSISHATDDIEIAQADTSKYQVINPEKKAYTSKKKVAFISGKAPSGTSITIKVYGTTDLTRKNFNLSKLPAKEDYIEIFSEVIKAGNMGYFDKQIKLVTGINKIVISFNVEGVSTHQTIILVEPKSTGPGKDIKLSDIMPSVK